MYVSAHCTWVFWVKIKEKCDNCSAPDWLECCTKHIHPTPTPTPKLHAALVLAQQTTWAHFPDAVCGSHSDGRSVGRKPRRTLFSRCNVKAAHLPCPASPPPSSSRSSVGLRSYGIIALTHAPFCCSVRQRPLAQTRASYCSAWLREVWTRNVSMVIVTTMT